MGAIVAASRINRKLITIAGQKRKAASSSAALCRSFPATEKPPTYIEFPLELGGFRRRRRRSLRRFHHLSNRDINKLQIEPSLPVERGVFGGHVRMELRP